MIDNKSALVQTVSRRHTHEQRVHYLDQWCSLKVLYTMGQMVSSPMIHCYLGIKHIY